MYLWYFFLMAILFLCDMTTIEGCENAHQEYPVAFVLDTTGSQKSSSEDLLTLLMKMDIKNAPSYDLTTFNDATNFNNNTIGCSNADGCDVTHVATTTNFTEFGTLIRGLNFGDGGDAREELFKGLVTSCQNAANDSFIVVTTDCGTKDIELETDIKKCLDKKRAVLFIVISPKMCKGDIYKSSIDAYKRLATKVINIDIGNSTKDLDGYIDLYKALEGTYKAEAMKKCKKLRGPRKIQNLQNEAVFLGQLYSARSDQLLVLNLYDNITRQNLTTIIEPKHTMTSVNTETDILDRLAELRIDDEQSVSFLGGLIEVSGAANYLTTREDFTDEVSVVISLQHQTHVKTIREFRLPDNSHTYICDLKQYPQDIQPTHVVTSLYMGFNAHIKFTKKVKKLEEKEQIREGLRVLIEKVPTIKNSNLTQEEMAFSQDIDIIYYGPPILENSYVPITTFEEAVNAYKYLKAVNNTGNVMTYQLHPLSSYCGGEPAILNSINYQDINEIKRMVRDLLTLQSLIMDLRRQNPKDLPSYGNIINTLEISLNSFFGEITLELKRLLPKARGGDRQAQLDLTNVIQKYLKSPLRLILIKRFIDNRKKELESIQYIVDTALGFQGKIIVDAGSSGDANECFLKSPYTVVLQLNILPGHAGTNGAYQYLNTPQGGWLEEKKWFTELPENGPIGQEFQDFIDFVKLNQNAEVCFLIKLKPLDNDKETKHAKLDVLDDRGRLLYKDFTPPGYVDVKELVRGWKELSIVVAFSANPSLTSLETKILDLSRTNQTNAVSMALNPLQSEATILLNDLKANNKYELSFTLWTKVGKGPTSSPIQTSTMPSKPQSKKNNFYEKE